MDVALRGGGSRFGATELALLGGYRNRFGTPGAGLGRGHVGPLDAPLGCLDDLRYQQEENQGDDEKVEGGAQEIAILQRDRILRCFALSQDDDVLAPITRGHRQRDEAHDELANHGGDDLSERGANYDAHGEIDDITFECELFEVLPNAHVDPP